MKPLDVPGSLLTGKLPTPLGPPTIVAGTHGMHQRVGRQLRAGRFDHLAGCFTVRERRPRGSGAEEPTQRDQWDGPAETYHAFG